MGVLLIQVLPVREIGKMLFDNQLNEEINCSGSTVKELSKCTDATLDNQEQVVQYGISMRNGLTAGYASFQSIIPVHHTSDVPVPPPNKSFVLHIC